MVAERRSWMLVDVRCGSGSKSSGARHVFSAPVKYWRAEHSELLEFMICVVEHDIVTQVCLKQASGEAWVLLEVGCQES